MTQDKRNEIKEKWFDDATEIREIRMPSEAKFFVGQTVIHHGEEFEIVGFYDYFGTFPHYLTLQMTGERKYYIIGIPLHVQGDMYLKSEEHLHQQQTAKIINMWDYFPKP